MTVEETGVMKKILNIILLATSLIGYIEWPVDHHIFTFQLEADLLWKQEHRAAFFHPLILIPFIGQILLVFTLFQKKPSSLLTYIAIACLSSIMLLLLLIGMLKLNFQMIICAMPFVAVSIFSIVYLRKQKVSSEK
jgi:hypothetical protein